MAGFQVVTIPSDARGNCDLEALRAAVGPDTAGADDHQPEHPRPLGRAHRGDHRRRPRGGRSGLQRRRQLQRHPRHRPARRSRHRRHALQPAQDLLHPARRRRSRLGTGRGARATWRSILPGAARSCGRSGAQRREDARVRVSFQPEESIGRLHAFHGNFGMFVRAYTYIRMHGAAGLRQVSEDAVLNANYIRAQPARSSTTCPTATAPACTRRSSRPPAEGAGGARRSTSPSASSISASTRRRSTSRWWSPRR